MGAVNNRAYQHDQQENHWQKYSDGHGQVLSEIRKKLAGGASVSQALSDQGELLGNEYIYATDIAQLHRSVQETILGAGPTIAPLLSEPAVTDVIINGTHGVWVDRGNGLEKINHHDSQLQDEASVRALAVRLAASCGQRLDDAAPIVDGTFPPGIRLHAVLPPLSAEGTLISLRTQRAKMLSIAQLSQLGSIHSQLVPIIKDLVRCKANVMISGATGAGKTTFLTAILSLALPSERILVIEEAAELHPQHPHIVHLQIRKANVQGAGEITISELVRAAMRMRPDRIVLGECRGGEVRDVLSALNTGHEGGWATIHANSAADVPARLVALGALAHMNEATVAAQAAAALDAVIHIRRAGQKRYLSEIAVLRRKDGLLYSETAYSVNSSGVLEVMSGANYLARRLQQRS